MDDEGSEDRVTRDLYFKCVSAVPKCATFDDYLDMIPEADPEDLRVIWDAAHRRIDDIAREQGLPLRQLGFAFGIPYNTVFNWSTDRGTNVHRCPVYVLLMIQEILGIYKPPVNL